MENKLAESTFLWIGSDGKTAEASTEGPAEGQTAGRPLLTLLGRYDSLRLDGRAQADGELYLEHLDEVASVETELIAAYFRLHSLPEPVVQKATHETDWTDEELAKMVAELRRFI